MTNKNKNDAKKKNNVESNPNISKLKYKPTS